MGCVLGTPPQGGVGVLPTLKTLTRQMGRWKQTRERMIAGRIANPGYGHWASAGHQNRDRGRDYYPGLPLQPDGARLGVENLTCGDPRVGLAIHDHAAERSTSVTTVTRSLTRVMAEISSGSISTL